MIGFAGLSHLGIVSCVCAASRGFDVIGFDSRSELCERLASGQLPILEPTLPELLGGNRDRLHFSNDAASLVSCEIIYFSLDVSTDTGNCSDDSGLRQLIDSVLPHASPNAILVVLSQVRPGFTRKLSAEMQPLIASRGLQLFYQVETLIFGRAVERCLQPERYILGCSDPDKPLPESLLKFLGVSCPVFTMRYESAELAKLSINVLLAASLSATNTLAEVCEKVGANWAEIIPTLQLDKRIGPSAYLSPGLGIGGGNIERDLVTLKDLAAEYGANDCVPAAFIAHSQHRRDWALRVLYRQVLSRYDQPTVAVWGLSYKPNTKSTKNSPTLALLDSLRDIPIRLYDPQATLDQPFQNVLEVSTALEACRGAKALMIMTGWEEFASISSLSVKEIMVNPLVIDPSGTWRQRNPAGQGFSYFTLGKQPGRAF